MHSLVGAFHCRPNGNAIQRSVLSLSLSLSLVNYFKTRDPKEKKKFSPLTHTAAARTKQMRTTYLLTSTVATRTTTRAETRPRQNGRNPEGDENHNRPTTSSSSFFLLLLLLLLLLLRSTPPQQHSSER